VSGSVNWNVPGGASMAGPRFSHVFMGAATLVVATTLKFWLMVMGVSGLSMVHAVRTDGFICVQWIGGWPQSASLSPVGQYHFVMPSFDIVSEVNSMEIENAVNIAKKELANRFDFKGSKAEIVLEKNDIKLSAEDQFKINALVEIVVGKLARRNVSMKNVDQGQPDVSPLGHARQVIKIKQGLATDVAKQVTTFVRDGKFKVTTQIQDQQIRVTGKSRDELQAVMAAVRTKDFPVALQFQNFRD